jgi:hypothetical protein
MISTMLDISLHSPKCAIKAESKIAREGALELEENELMTLDIFV